MRGSFLMGRQKDLPHLIWLPDFIEPAENFESFFSHSDNKVLSVRNVHLLNHRNFGSSDHHESFALDEMANDIIRYMDKNAIQMATIGGHGFGAKVATVAAINHMDRFTGVMCLEGGPVDQTFHPMFTTLKKCITRISKLKLDQMSVTEVHNFIDNNVECKHWGAIFKQCLNTNKGYPQWDFNLDAVMKNTKKKVCDLAAWQTSYGLYPGRVWALFATYSHWIHLSTNTLPFYYTFPRLEGRFNTPEFNIFGNMERHLNHWPHKAEDPSERFQLGNRMWRWLKDKDGVNVLLNDRSELGWYYLPDRGTDASVGTGQGEYTPEHVHYNYKSSSKKTSNLIL